MMKETCINCKYNEKDTDDREGFCHRYPPNYRIDDEQGTVFIFTVIDDDDWCGEWKLK